jgi:hypothetical protein
MSFAREHYYVTMFGHENGGCYGCASIGFTMYFPTRV